MFGLCADIPKIIREKKWLICLINHKLIIINHNKFMDCVSVEKKQQQLTLVENIALHHVKFRPP